MSYPKIYHEVIGYLVKHGAHGPNRPEARRTIAKALRFLRHAFGRECARRERYHMYFISGQLPVKS